MNDKVYGKIDGITLLDPKEVMCFCGAKIFRGEPCGAGKNGYIYCYRCTLEILKEEKLNANKLLKEFEKLYKEKEKLIITNRF